MKGKDLYSIQNFLDVQKMTEQEQKGIDKMLDLIVDNIYDGNVENNKEFKKLNRQIGIAYNTMKDQFAEIFRDDGERYFEHLRAVTNIVLEFIPEPNKEKVLIALLHDSIEDTNIDFHTLNILFGSKVAIAVVGLSKKDWKLYLKKEETELFFHNNGYDEETFKEMQDIIKGYGKKRRNEEYFGHLESFDSMLNYVKSIINEEDIEGLNEEDIIEITKNIIDVKLADRIHNLSTQWDEKNLDKVKRKVEETNPKAYEKLKVLILDLEIKLYGVNGKIDNIVI